MAVEEKGRGSDELYDNGYSRAKKSPVFALVPLALDESRLRLWNSLVKKGLNFLTRITAECSDLDRYGIQPSFPVITI